MDNCPCCSGKTYDRCCKVYHDGCLPETALALMKSRYSAYALGKSRYIMETTHPNSPYIEKDREKWEKGILEFCNTTQFLKLEIVSHGKDWVHFIAYLKQTKEFILEEKSSFGQIDSKWLYTSRDLKFGSRAGPKPWD